MLAAINWSQGVEDAWRDVVSFAPKLLAFLVILILGYIVAKLIASALDKVLERVGFDKWVERGGVAKVMATSSYDASSLVSKLAFYALFLLVLQAAFGVFGPNPISDLLTQIIAYLPKVIVAVVIVVVGAAIASAIREVIRAALGGLSYGTMLANAASVVILVIAGFAALSQLEIAPAIVNGLFYGILAIIAGIAVVAVGGGGVRPMQTRWESALRRIDAEKASVSGESKGAADRVAQRAKEIRNQADPNRP